MAITLIFGLLVAMFLVLFVVPGMIAIQEDFRRIFRRPDPYGTGSPTPAE